MSEILDSSKLKILIACHKPCDLPDNTDGYFIPVRAGAGEDSDDAYSSGVNEESNDLYTQEQLDNFKNMQRDDDGENISSKHYQYAELTALYWAWKNIDSSCNGLEYIGLNHYRRYFAFNDKRYWTDSIITDKKIKEYKLDISKISNDLADGYTIVNQPAKYPYPIYIDYSVHHDSDSLRLLYSIIKEDFNEYYKSFCDVIMIGNRLSSRNMMIMRKNDFYNYCNFLFNVLDTFEKRYVSLADERIGVDHQDGLYLRLLPSRTLGLLGERLFNVWLYKNMSEQSIRIKPYQYYEFLNQSNERVAKRFINSARWDITYNILKPRGRNKYNFWERFQVN